VKTLLLATVMMALGYSPLVAQDVDKGERAYNAGDYAKALTDWLPLAERGNASAQSNLGVMYHNGEGLKQDTARAFLLYSLAAKQGHANAQFNLGLMYALGDSIPQDYSKAVKWWHLAAEQGHAGAQSNLGNRYSRGQGVQQDHAKALRWWRLAAVQGNPKAQYNLLLCTHLERLLSKIMQRPTCGSIFPLITVTKRRLRVEITLRPECHLKKYLWLARGLKIALVANIKTVGFNHLKHIETGIIHVRQRIQRSPEVLQEPSPQRQQVPV
jgi:hypothetical protein